ncbi:MAG: cell division protein FtsZ [Stappiaceae bacterium]
MTINLKMPDITELKPRITVYGVGGAGGNAVNNMIQTGLLGCDFVVANTDAQALASSQADRVIQMGVDATEGLGAGSQPEIGRAAAEEAIDEIKDHLAGSHMVFITAGMGGGTGTGAAPVVAEAAREMGILTVGVVTKPFHFEGQRRMKIAESGIGELQSCVDTLIVIPNQNLFRIANDRTTFADAFSMADQVLYSGVASVTDLMVKEGLINLDFADVRSVMRAMGKAMMGTGEASGENRAMQAAEAAIANPLLDETSMKGARGLLISISGGSDLTLFEVDEAATRIREEVDPEANIILGATFDESLDGIIRVSVVATGIDKLEQEEAAPASEPMVDLATRLKGATATTSEASSESQPDVAAELSATEHLEQELALPESVVSTTDPEVTISAYQNHDIGAGNTLGVDIEDAITSGINEEAPSQAPYIPPTADEPSRTARRVPTVEEFPPIAQREYHAKVPPAPQQSAPSAARPAANARPSRPTAPRANIVEESDERRPMGLLRRLATGLGRKEGEENHIAENTPRPSHLEPSMSPRPPAPSQTAAPAPDYKPRPTQRPAAEQAPSGQLDPHGRQPQKTLDDDQLEIPAFLRRQSN